MGEAPGSERLLSSVIRKRRATPHFDGTPMAEADLQRILAAGLLAPSGYNLQPWRFIVVRSNAQKTRLRVAAMNQAQVQEASVVIVACGDSEGWKEDVETVIEIGRRYGAGDEESSRRMRAAVHATFSGQHRDLGGFEGQSLAWVNRQVMIAFTTMLWMAETLGYDTAPMEGFSASAVGKVLRLPPSVHPVAMLAIGRLQGPDKKYLGRLPSARTCFAERWASAMQIDLP